jgi:hypothetical protein
MRALILSKPVNIGLSTLERAVRAGDVRHCVFRALLRYITAHTHDYLLNQPPRTQQLGASTLLTRLTYFYQNHIPDSLFVGLNPRNHTLVAYQMPSIISANFGALSGLSDLKGRKKKTPSGPDQVESRQQTDMAAHIARVRRSIAVAPLPTVYKNKHSMPCAVLDTSTASTTFPRLKCIWLTE